MQLKQLQGYASGEEVSQDSVLPDISQASAGKGKADPMTVQHDAGTRETGMPEKGQRESFYNSFGANLRTLGDNGNATIAPEQNQHPMLPESVLHAPHDQDWLQMNLPIDDPPISGNTTLPTSSFLIPKQKRFRGKGAKNKKPPAQLSHRGDSTDSIKWGHRHGTNSSSKPPPPDTL